MIDDDRVPMDPAGAAAPAPPPPPYGIAVGGLALALLGLVALALGQVEVALYLVAATLFLAAQAADVHPALARLYAFLGWIPAALGAALLGSIAFLTVRGVTLSTAVPHLAVAAFAAAGALVSLALLFPAAADACVRGLFRGAAPDHTMRLAATLVVVTLWTGPSLWFLARDVLAEFLADPRRLVSTDVAGHRAGRLRGCWPSPRSGSSCAAAGASPWRASGSPARAPRTRSTSSAATLALWAAERRRSSGSSAPPCRACGSATTPSARRWRACWARARSCCSGSAPASARRSRCAGRSSRSWGSC